MDQLCRWMTDLWARNVVFVLLLVDQRKLLDDHFSCSQHVFERNNGRGPIVPRLESTASLEVVDNELLHVHALRKHSALEEEGTNDSSSRRRGEESQENECPQGLFRTGLRLIRDMNGQKEEWHCIVTAILLNRVHILVRRCDKKLRMGCSATQLLLEMSS
jgi:hypothetical protein